MSGTKTRTSNTTADKSSGFLLFPNRPDASLITRLDFLAQQPASVPALEWLLSGPKGSAPPLEAPRPAAPEQISHVKQTLQISGLSSLLKIFLVVLLRPQSSSKGSLANRSFRFKAGQRLSQIRQHFSVCLSQKSNYDWPTSGMALRVDARRGGRVWDPCIDKCWGFIKHRAAHTNTEVWRMKKGISIIEKI